MHCDKATVAVRSNHSPADMTGADTSGVAGDRHCCRGRGAAQPDGHMGGHRQRAVSRRVIGAHVPTDRRRGRRVLLRVFSERAGAAAGPGTVSWTQHPARLSCWRRHRVHVPRRQRGTCMHQRRSRHPPRSVPAAPRSFATLPRFATCLHTRLGQHQTMCAAVLPFDAPTHARWSPRSPPARTSSSTRHPLTILRSPS